MQRSITLKRHPTPAIATIVLAAVSASLGAPGCSWNEKIKLAADGSPEYQNLQISYDLASTPDLKRLEQPPPIEQTAGVKPASKGLPALPARPWTGRRVHLEIQYPCPGVHPGFARATLRIVTEKKKQVEKPFTWAMSAPTYEKVGGDFTAADESLFIDIPKSELDGVLTELAQADFFKVPSNPDGESHLLVVFNKGQCEKGWTREEHLDQLVDLLRRHGAPLPAPPAKPKKS